MEEKPYFETVPLEVTISASETISGPDGKPFTVYCVRIAHTNTEGEIVSWKAVHKFGHLLNLYDRLRGRYPEETAGLKFPKPISRLDVAEQESRKNGLEVYLQKIVDTPVLRMDESVKSILLLRERNFTSKYQTMRTKGRPRAAQEGESSSPRSPPSPRSVRFAPRISKSKSELEIGNQRQKFVQDAYGTYPRKLSKPQPVELDDGSNLSDTDIEKILLNNTRHPSNLGPLLRHYIAASPTKVVVEEAPEIVAIPVIMKTVGKVSYTPQNPVLQKKTSTILPKVLVQATGYILESGADMDVIMKGVPNEKNVKIQDAVGCFFSFLMSIPAPLLGYEMHPYFISIAEEKSAELKLEASRNLVSMLQSNFQTEMLRFFLEFLFQIAKRSKFLPGPMEAIGNIVVQLVFGTECCESDFQLANETSQFMVQNFLKIFF
eukprot:Phypoly_transcript_07324.p1 GENE.Phypoly_transcript_07324~~Phypoly_transcript_07324.p1  ORF type:complete len:434 (-),score=72.48 Phypoly_transcript_07324:118-1419(-)